MQGKKQKIHGRGGSIKGYKLISVYPDPDLRKKLDVAAAAEHRSLGNMICEIIRQYFIAQEKTEG